VTGSTRGQINADDLAMLADGFASAMLCAGCGRGGPLFDLGWGGLLAAAPGQGVAMAFLRSAFRIGGRHRRRRARAIGLDVADHVRRLPRPIATPPAA
jgi:hypothetical protein